MTWSLTLSSKTTACLARSLRTCIPLNGQSTSGALDLVAAAALPPHSADFPLQLLDLAHVWSERREITTLTSSTFSLWQTGPGWAYEPRYLRPLPELFAGIARLFARGEPTTHRRCTQHGQFSKLHAESSAFLEVLNCEIATPTPAAWIEIFERRLSLWEEQQPQLPHHPNILAAQPIVFPDCAHLIAEIYVQNHSFGANSRASQVGASAWFISVAFWSGIGCCTLVMSQWPITISRQPAAQHPLAILRMLLPRSHWKCAWHFSHHQKVPIRLHAHDLCSDTSHSESFSKIIIYDRETASSSGLSHVPSNSMSIPIPGGMICRDSCLQPSTRNSLGTSGHVFEGLHARGEASSALSEKSKNLASSSCRLKPTDTGRVAKKEKD